MDRRFYEWLINDKQFSNKGASDVVSRLRRASFYINIEKGMSSNEVDFALNENNQFIELSKFVKSQIRRAVKLHNEYNSQHVVK